MDDITQLAVEYKSLAVGFWLLALFVGERLAPAVERRGGWPRILRNAGLWLCNAGLSLAIIIPLSQWASGSALDWRPDVLPGWVHLVIDLVMLDFLIYWWHRANHRVPLLWRFHEVHHLDEFLDVSSSVRFHFGEVLLSAGFRALIVILLDVPVTSVLAFEAAVLMAAAFHHSNLRLPTGLERALSHLVITPSIHWIHHHAVRRDTDSNYGTILSLWDGLFGSRSGTQRTHDLPIGVEQAHDVGLVRLLLKPFAVRNPAAR